MLQATSTARQVQVALDAAQQTDYGGRGQGHDHAPQQPDHPGRRLIGGRRRHLPIELRSSGSSSSSAEPGTDTCSSSSATPTITVDVIPSDPAATGTWDQAPVQVGITTAKVPSALVVPVTALLAQSNGGYDVEVVGAAGINHLVPVSLGLFDDADGLVAVTGSRLAAGQQVVVPTT